MQQVQLHMLSRQMTHLALQCRPLQARKDRLLLVPVMQRPRFGKVAQRQIQCALLVVLQSRARGLLHQKLKNLHKLLVAPVPLQQGLNRMHPV